MPVRSAPDALKRKLGARIRALRLEADLTQERLAWDCDLDKSYLSQVESGQRAPSIGVLGLLARRLRVELADLVAVNGRSPRLQLLDAARRGNFERAEQLLRVLRER